MSAIAGIFWGIALTAIKPARMTTKRLPLTKHIFRVIGITMSVVSLSTCSPLSNDSGRSISLPQTPASSAQSWILRQISSSPYIYQNRPSEDTQAKVSYVTAIEACDLRKNVSNRALWRQLLVGLSEIRVQKQEERVLGNEQVLFSLIDAKLDSIPVKLACYTRKNHACVVDYVLWAEINDQDKNSFELFFDEQLARFQDFLEKVVTVQPLAWNRQEFQLLTMKLELL